MLDNDVEAVGGFRIDQVATQVEKAFPFLPNVVLMHFGSNDAVQDYDVAHAHERLGALIDRVFSAIPGVTVVVSTLIPSLDATVESRIQVINSNIPAMVQSRVDQGKKVQLVDMHDGLITAADHFDSLHPNDGRS
jgi:lysophospholipase L1-like esterase